MLALLFSIGDQRYAIDCVRVVEVVPRVELRDIPHAPAGVAGLFNYRGAMVPVLDLCAMMAETSSRTHLSTRIILVRYGDDQPYELLGVVAERVTATERLKDEDFHSAGVEITDAPFLGDVAVDEERNQTVQCIDVEHLVPESIRSILFPAMDAHR